MSIKRQRICAIPGENIIVSLFRFLCIVKQRNIGWCAVPVRSSMCYIALPGTYQFPKESYTHLYLLCVQQLDGYIYIFQHHSNADTYWPIMNRGPHQGQIFITQSIKSDKIAVSYPDTYKWTNRLLWIILIWGCRFLPYAEATIAELSSACVMDCVVCLL